jgi:hypothetical protein
LDEIRSTASAATASSSGNDSAKSTLTKTVVTKKVLPSLAVEMGDLSHTEYEEDGDATPSDEENTDGESGFVETIITTSRKRVSIKTLTRYV